MDEKPEKAMRDQILQFMTTEHFTMQTARAATVAESNGRVSLYIGAVSSAVVALAFIGQVAGVSESFFVFGLVLFPSLIFLGVITFDRVLESALEDWMYTCESIRIRHFYAEIAPEMKSYFVDSLHDDAPWILENVGLKTGTWQFFLTGSGMVGVINSILAGVFAGLAGKFGFALNLYICAGIGIVFFIASVWLHHLRQLNRFGRVGNNFKALFPKKKPEKE